MIRLETTTKKTILLQSKVPQWPTVFLEKVRVAVKKFLIFINPEGSLPCSHLPSSCPYSEHMTQAPHFFMQYSSPVYS